MLTDEELEQMDAEGLRSAYRELRADWERAQRDAEMVNLSVQHAKIALTDAAGSLGATSDRLAHATDRLEEIERAPGDEGKK